ncbi:hypothetical protein IJJ08_01290 [bacterium]|nr:hypothetical protein [bacterium]
MQKVTNCWQWCEQWWRVAPTPDNGWNKQKMVAWALALVSLAWSFATSYYATRVRLLASEIKTQESAIYE